MKRPLLLTGMMATGKTTVGRALAERVGVAHFDLDELVTQRAGRSVAEIFADQGEAAFRRLERQVLLELLQQWAGRPVVVSLGGGALVDGELRVEALHRAVVVCLTASATEIARRARAQDAGRVVRPLLAGTDPEGALERLLAARSRAYREVHGRVETEGQTADQIATQVRALWDRDEIVVAAGDDTYLVTVADGVLETELPRHLVAATGALLVSDSNVAPLHGAPVRKAIASVGLVPGYVELTPGEEHKNLTGLAQIYQGAFDASLDRKCVFVGLGGGVTTDMTGFAAATWVRGVRWVGLPTTLLSMVDASVGGKTGVDFHTAKNSVGAFWQPVGVICDVATLQTETERMYRGALSEVIKTALIGDETILSVLEDRTTEVLGREPQVLVELVERCIRVKARIVGLDERELGIRATLNLGHTIGHALESAGGYTALTHGEAVGLGLIAALRFGERRGHTPPELTGRMRELLVRLGLVHRLERSALVNCADLLARDKKRAGNAVKFVFARAVGDVTTESVALDQLGPVLGELADNA